MVVPGSLVVLLPPPPQLLMPTTVRIASTPKTTNQRRLERGAAKSKSAAITPPVEGQKRLAGRYAALDGAVVVTVSVEVADEPLRGTEGGFEVHTGIS